MGPAPCEDDSFGFPIQLPVGGVSVADNDAGESFQEFPRMVCFPGLLVFIQDNGCIPISLSRPVNQHVTLAVCRAPILRYPNQSLIGLQHMETVHPVMKVIIKRSQIPIRTLDHPVRYHLLGDVDIIPQEFLTDSI